MFLTNLILYIILGLIQGFTEPIPISSSGHLVIVKTLFNLNILNDLNFEIIVNFGSLIAICLIFYQDIKEIISHFFKYLRTKELQYYYNYKYLILIIIATIPAGIIGLLTKDIIEKYANNVKLIAVALLITSLFLYMIRNINGKKNDQEITFKNAIVIGLCQALALFPGISRSGATIVGGMIQNLKRDTAFKFSFMLYIPISIATMILGINDLISSNQTSQIWFYYLAGMLSSGILTYFSVKWFRNIMNKGKLIYFVYYCILVGTLVLLFM
ncbi:MAG: undecaprenyl-diphosphate phosphatase [Bacilli bacterium]